MVCRSKPNHKEERGEEAMEPTECENEQHSKKKTSSSLEKTRLAKDMAKEEKAPLREATEEGAEETMEPEVAPEENAVAEA